MSDPGDNGSRAGEATRGRGVWDRVRAAIGLKPPATLREDLTEVLAEEQPETEAFTPAERTMLRNILALRHLRVADVMVPRSDILAVEQAISLGELLRLFRDAGHSRLPVFRGSLDDPLGMVHIRDFLAYLTAGAPRAAGEPAADPDLGQIDLTRTLEASGITRTVIFVPPSKRALDLLREMQGSRVHMALVIDEYGGTDGLVSIEDLIETVVGDIEDEHDEDQVVIVPAEGGWIASARASLDEVRISVGAGADWGNLAEAEDVDTIGGLITTLAGRVPGRGERILGPAGFEFEVLDADPRRLKRLRIVRTTPDPNEVSPALGEEALVDPRHVHLPEGTTPAEMSGRGATTGAGSRDT